MRAYLVIGAMVGLGAFARGGVIVEIVDEPQYWSHTNNRIICHAEITPGTNGITAYEVLVGTTVVAGKTYMAGPMYRIEINPKVMFDSTQWSHLSSLTVTFRVKTTDSPTTWNTDTHTVYVKNKAGIYSDPVLAHDGDSTLENGYSGINYDTLLRNTPWTMSTYFSDVTSLTAVDLNVHGFYNLHKDGNDPEYDSAGWDEYDSPLASKIGSGLPPFNSTNWPPLNFVHFNACEMGESVDWKDVLFPKQNAYSSGQIENQAVLCYKVYTLDGFHDEMSEAIMTELTAGNTVTYAKSRLFSCDEVEVRDTENGNNRLIELDDIVILGDSATRLTKVYTGSSVPTSATYRVLQQD